jgi:hypothetical protein
MNQIQEHHIKVYTPDENTQLLDDFDNPPFIREFNVNTNHALSIDPNWQNIQIGYIVVLPVVNPPDANASYWVEIDGEKKRVNFSHYESKGNGKVLYLQGN